MSAVAVQSAVTRSQWAQVASGDQYAMADQSASWVAAICSSGPFRDATRSYRTPDGRVFVLPLVSRTGIGSVGGWLLSPPPAWGFGGLIGADLDADVVADVVDDLRGLRCARISIRPDPLRADLWSKVQGPDVVRIPRCAHVIDLEGGVEAVEARYSKKTRQSVRQGIKRGVTVKTVRSGELLGVHHDLYLLSVQRWAAKQREPLKMAQWRARRRDPLHKLEAMADQLGDAFCHHVGYHDGHPVSSTIVLLGNSAHDTRGAMDRDRAAPVRANEVVQAHAVRVAIEEGCRYYHLGESGESESLAHSKAKFGAVGYPYDEIRIERLPITRVDTWTRSLVKKLIGFRDT